MAMQKIGKFSLKNQGGFVARMQVAYINDDGEKKLTKQSGDVLLGETETIDIKDYGVPDEAMVYLYVFVVWGRDNEAKRAFIFESGNTNVARYVISGTTLSNELALIEVES